MELAPYTLCPVCFSQPPCHFLLMECSLGLKIGPVHHFNRVSDMIIQEKTVRRYKRISSAEREALANP
jgi:hypothetical protein